MPLSINCIRVAMLGVLVLIAPRALAEPSHGIAMHGEPALPADYQHMPHVNPAAPKGGKIGYGFVGTFDSLNPFIVKGNAPRGIWDGQIGNNIVEPLMSRADDEPFSLYGLLAESVEMDDERSFIEFNLHPAARFSDGEPVTPEDVIFTANLLKEKGRPNYRSRFRKVDTIEKVGELGVRFTFGDETDRELPLLIALMPVLPEHATDAATFDQSSLEPLVGSGPYEVSSVEPGQRLILKRRDDYWAKDLPVKRGYDNFDEIRLEYFRDASSHFEAFKKGLFDVNPEGDPGRWAQSYDFPAVQSGDVVKDEYESGTPKGMTGIVMNTRRTPLDDPKVREALTYFLDFEWLNKNLFFDVYSRSGSYFQGSNLSALGQPASEGERALLDDYPDAVKPSVMDGTYRPPVSNGSGRDRKNLRQALKLLQEAGYKRQGGKLVNAETGEPLSLEYLVQTKEQERVALALQRSLALAGIDLQVRLVDSTQYWDRLKAYDYDLVQFTYTASLSPGAEQNFRWRSQSADTEGTFNFAGAKNPAADAMIDALLAARDRAAFTDAVRALDRVLVSGDYVVPLFNLPKQWVARWSRIETPETTPLYGYQPTAWWSKEAEGS